MTPSQSTFYIPDQEPVKRRRSVNLFGYVSDIILLKKHPEVESCTFHDIKAKAISDDGDKPAFSEHASKKMMDLIYDRKIQSIRAHDPDAEK